MSFDLYFYKSKGSQLTEDQVAQYLDKNIQYNISDHPKQWNYENPATGVYFLIDWNEVDEDPESVNTFDNFQDYRHLNFTCSINFFRPHFFGLEIFPILEKFVKDLDLYVLNPQDETDPDNPIRFTETYLQEQWTRHNEKVTLDQFKELNFLYLPLEKSNYLWWYQTHRDELQESFGEDVFVPGYFVLKGIEDEQLYTACVWPKHIPIILPPVDFLIVQRNYKKFFRTVEESGLVSFDTIIREFGDYFEKFDYSVPDLKILRQSNADKIEKKFNGLALGKSVADFGNGVSFDGFVNVRP